MSPVAPSGELLRRAQSEDHTAFTSLIRECDERMRRLAHRVPLEQTDPTTGDPGAPFGTDDGFFLFDLEAEALWSTVDGSSWTWLRDYRPPDEDDLQDFQPDRGVLNGEVVSLPSLLRLDGTPVLPADSAQDIKFLPEGIFRFVSVIGIGPDFVLIQPFVGLSEPQQLWLGQLR